VVRYVVRETTGGRGTVANVNEYMYVSCQRKKKKHYIVASTNILGASKYTWC